MERMKKKKKEIRLRTFFVRFLLKLVAAVLLAFLLWLLQITVSVGTGLILPANAAEKEALAYLHTIGAHTDIVSSGIPSACGYAIYDASGALLETDMSGSIRENADLLALSGQDSLSANMLGRTYVKRQTDTRIVVLTYDFRSAFANPTLRRLFPSAELLEVFLLLFLLLYSSSHGRQNTCRGNFFICRKLPTKSAIRISTLPSGRLPSANSTR